MVGRLAVPGGGRNPPPTFLGPKMAIGHGRGPKFSPHVPIPILSWVWEEKVKIFVMGLLWPHFKKFCWTVRNAKFPIFWKWQKWKKLPKLGHFWSKWLQILYSSWVFPKGETFIFWPKKFDHKPSRWRPFCIFAKNAFFDFGGPLRGPQTKNFRKNGPRSCV